MNRDDKRPDRRLQKRETDTWEDERTPETELTRARTLLREALRAERDGLLLFVQTLDDDVVLPFQYEVAFVPGPDGWQ